MQDLTQTMITILHKYMGDPAAQVAGSTNLSDLKLDQLDLPMICLDVEDAFDVQIENHDIEDGATVGGLAACVALHIEAKALRPRPSTTVPRSRGTWLSPSAQPRR